MRNRIPSFLILAGVACGAAWLLFSPLLSAKDKKNKPYSELPIVASKKKAEDDITQTLPLAKEPPAAVAADPRRLVFQTSALASKGLLSSQAREALRTLLRNCHGATVVMLRAFVAGSGDMRRVQDLTAEVFGEKHQSMPALSIVQAGALPLEGAQVVIESISEDKRVTNPNGLAFISAQTGANLNKALEKLRAVLQQAGAEPSETLRVTCFVSSIDNAAGMQSQLSGFGGAAVNLVQMQREPVRPAAACEAVARLSAPAAEPLRWIRGENGETRASLVSGSRVAFSGMQLAFGSQPEDIRLAFDRLDKALGSVRSDLQGTAMSHAYVMSESQSEKIRAALPAYGGKLAPAATFVPMEGLPSLDARFAIDVVAVARE